MPNLRIETNVSAETIKELNTCLAELSKAVSESTGKPEEYVIVQIIPGLPMMFAGSDAPCASAFFMSIGKISPEENKVSSDIFTSISSYQIFPARPTPLLCIRLSRNISESPGTECTSSSTTRLTMKWPGKDQPLQLFLENESPRTHRTSHSCIPYLVICMRF